MLSFYKWENWESGWYNDLPQVTQCLDPELEPMSPTLSNTTRSQGSLGKEKRRKASGRNSGIVFFFLVDFLEWHFIFRNFSLHVCIWTFECDKRQAGPDLNSWLFNGFYWLHWMLYCCWIILFCLFVFWLTIPVMLQNKSLVISMAWIKYMCRYMLFSLACK